MNSPVLRALNVPSAVTMIGVLGGGAALLGGAGNRPLLTACGVGVALLTDKLDGALARRLNQRSDFGAQLDSLSDGLAFVAAPALAAAHAAPGGLGVVIAAVYLLCGLARLAAFHSTGTQQVRGRECFYGVPTPAAGAAFLLAQALAPLGAPVLPWLVLLVLGPLMITSLPYPKRGAHDVFCATAAVVAIAIEGTRAWLR